MLASWHSAMAEPWQIRSGSQRALMIELFTSEGCNSCPPAEALLNRFTDNPRLWESFIPLAFHVDYWDDLGWRDRYALAANAARQRRYASLGHVRGVYTPAFMVNGRGWRPGWTGRMPAADEPAPGLLTVSVAGNQVMADYRAADGSETPLQLEVALLGVGLSSDIEAGENRGRHARHDFVVLARHQLSGGGPQWRGELPPNTQPAAQRLALAAWVSRAGDPTPLQAVGGWLPPDQ
jgi:hypothetical protein